MKNREKFSKEILDIVITGDVLAVNVNNGKPCSCDFNTGCESCLFCNLNCNDGRKNWLEAEYEEPKVDWSKVSVDTPILVRNYNYDFWKRRYFACYKNGNVFAFDSGKTSWSADEKIYWKYAKLAEKGNEE